MLANLRHAIWQTLENRDLSLQGGVDDFAIIHHMLIDLI